MESLNNWFDGAFASTPVMAILRGFSPERTVALSRTAWDAGITCVEVPLGTPGAFESLIAAVVAGADRGRLVGAGTITSPGRVDQAAHAGAAFTVAPGLDPEVAGASHSNGLPHLPGVATPSDIQSAQRLGHSWVKAFPATALSPAWFKAMTGPFPGLNMVATGGMNAGNAAQYLTAGARVIAVGSALEDTDQLHHLSQLIDTSAHR